MTKVWSYTCKRCKELFMYDPADVFEKDVMRQRFYTSVIRPGECNHVGDTPVVDVLHGHP